MKTRRTRVLLRVLILLVAMPLLSWLVFAVWQCSLIFEHALVAYAGARARTSSWGAPCGVLPAPEYDPDCGCFVIESNDLRYQVFPMTVADGRLSADEDGDGLNLREEIVRLTSDSCFDSDGDGLSDAVDPSPRGGVRDREARVLEKMLSRVTRRPVLSHETLDGPPVPQPVVYVISPYPPRHDLRLDGCQVVELDKAVSAAFLRYVAPKTAPVYFPEAQISMPGLVYLYGVHGMISGSGYSSVQLILDLPVVGPVRVWSR